MTKTPSRYQSTDRYLSTLAKCNKERDINRARELKKVLENFDKNLISYMNTEHFSQTLDFVVERDVVSLNVIAEKFEIDKSTAARWKRGESAPHPLVRQLILNWLQPELRKAIRKLDPKGHLMLIN